MWRVPLLLVLAVALAYTNALGGPFQFDDFDAFVEVPAAHDWAAWWADLGRGLRPLLKLSYLVDWQLAARFGGGALVFHLDNLLIHAANVLLVARLVDRACVRWLPALDLVARRRAVLVAALLFALHPAQTEAVTYISGRSVSLMTLLMLASTLAYLQRRWWLAAALYVLAMATKEPAAVLPLLFALAEACGLSWRRADGPRRGVVWRLGAFLLLPLLLGGWMVLHSRYREFLLASLGTRTIGDNLLSQLQALRYLAELALGLRAPNIDPALAGATQWTPALAASAALLLALLAATVALRRTRPWWSFGLGWCLIGLLPTNSILPRYDLVNDRQLYLPLIGLSLALALELAARGAFAAGAWRRVAPPLLALALLLGAGTQRRNADYASEIALWRATVAAAPDKARPYNNLGYAYQLAGCDAEAAAAYRRALEREPDYQRARDNLLVIEARAAAARRCR